MNFFSNFFGINRTTETGAGNSSYTADEMLGVYKDLTYLECRDIYRYWALGKRIASSLPNFAMSANRVFTCGEHPKIIIDSYADLCAQYNIDNLIKQTAIYARIYGLASLYLAIDNDEDDLSEPLSYKKITEYNFSFNSLDPLSMGGNIMLDTNPLSVTFQKPIVYSIQGRTIAPNRIIAVTNDIPLYLKFNPSSFSFSGASVYQNMTLLIRSWNRCVVAMQRLTTKAGAMVKVSKEVSQASGINMMAVKRNLDLVRSIENDGIASIQNGETITGFELTGMSEIDKVVEILNNSLMMALSDTPSGILLDRDLAQGFSDGTEDMKAILMAVEAFRNAILRPLYNFVDKILLYKLLTPSFLQEIKETDAEKYGDMSEADIFMSIRQDFKAELGEIYPASPRDTAEAKEQETRYLENLKGLDVTPESLEKVINDSPILDNGIELIKEDEDEGDDDFGGGFSGGSRGGGSSRGSSGDAKKAPSTPKASPTPKASAETPTSAPAPKADPSATSGETPNASTSTSSPSTSSATSAPKTSNVPTSTPKASPAPSAAPSSASSE